jgi:hypothetical protein
VTAYSIYSQLPCISGGSLSIRGLRAHHAMERRDPPDFVSHMFIAMKMLHNSPHVLRPADYLSDLDLMASDRDDSPGATTKQKYDPHILYF